MTDSPTARPRVVGAREQEILDATLEVLGEVGYDLLTMDAVAKEARASKATLYRRWRNKPTLVIDALLSVKDVPAVPDTGSLREDLREFSRHVVMDPALLTIMAAVLTAVQRDHEFATQFRERFLGPKVTAMRQVFEQARSRGELRDDVDIALLAPALPGIVLHRAFVLGILPTRAELDTLIDQVILRAACPDPS